MLIDTSYDFSTTIATGNWYNFVVQKTGTVYSVYKDGTHIGGVTSSVSFTSTKLNVGGLDWAPGYGIKGYIDEFRVTKGYARYTSNFTTSSTEFPNRGQQVATKYIGSIGGLNDTNVDYGVEKINNTSLKVKKMTASGQPIGSGSLSANVDRVYVNVVNYTTTSSFVSSSHALTSSYLLYTGATTGSGASASLSLDGYLQISVNGNLKWIPFYV
jgi:hypothetical protein